MSAQQLISQLADSARAAGKSLSVSSGKERKEALNVIADAIEANLENIAIAESSGRFSGKPAYSCILMRS